MELFRGLAAWLATGVAVEYRPLGKGVGAAGAL